MQAHDNHRSHESCCTAFIWSHLAPDARRCLGRAAAIAAAREHSAVTDTDVLYAAAELDGQSLLNAAAIENLHIDLSALRSDAQRVMRNEHVIHVEPYPLDRNLLEVLASLSEVQPVTTRRLLYATFRRPSVEVFLHGITSIDLSHAEAESRPHKRWL